MMTMMMLIQLLLMLLLPAAAADVDMQGGGAEAISDVTINKGLMTDSHFPRFFGVVVRSKSSSLYNF